jgi:type IV pilus assembly protein PilE
MDTRTHYYQALRARGFTLIELLVVVAIIAILAAITVTSYRAQVTKSTRAAAKSCLSQYSLYMERFYTTRFTYVDADNVANWPILDCTTDGNMAARYAFSLDTSTGALTAGAYRLRAIPTTPWLARDSRCGTLTVNQAGERTAAGSSAAADITYCW